MTLGSYRVRLTFNPSGNDLVDQLKQKTAELIDLCEQSKSYLAEAGPGGSVTAVPNAEVNRLWALAQTHFEDAAMWAVKAATSPMEGTKLPEYPSDHPVKGDLGSIPL